MPDSAAPTPDDPFPTLVEAFLWALGTTRPSPHTVAAYRRDLLGIGARIAAPAGEDLDGLRLEHLTKSSLRAGFAAWASDHATASVLRAHSALRRQVRAARVLAVLMTTVSTLTVATVPALAGPAQPRMAAVPAAASPPLDTVDPARPVGDFRDAPPNPSNPGVVTPNHQSSFDPAKATVLDAETTPTRMSYRGADGTHTDVLSIDPVRYRDAAGAWRDIDLTAVAAPDGSLVAKSAERTARLANARRPHGGTRHPPGRHPHRPPRRAADRGALQRPRWLLSSPYPLSLSPSSRRRG